MQPGDLAPEPEGGFSPDELPEPSLPQPTGNLPEEDELADIGEIDPDLLDEEGRGKSEWLILLGGAFLVILSLLLLFALFF